MPRVLGWGQLSARNWRNFPDIMGLRSKTWAWSWRAIGWLDFMFCFILRWWRPQQISKWEMRTLKPQPRLTTSGIGPSDLHVNQASRWFWHILKLEHLGYDLWKEKLLSCDPTHFTQLFCEDRGELKTVLLYLLFQFIWFSGIIILLEAWFGDLCFPGDNII